MDLVEEEHASTHWDLVDDRAAGAGAGTEDVEPCRVVALGAVEEGAWCSYGEGAHKSHSQAAAM